MNSIHDAYQLIVVANINLLKHSLEQMFLVYTSGSINNV